TDGGAALLQTLGDAGTQRHYALFFEIVDGAQVHLRGIDKIVHGPPSVNLRVYRLSRLNWVPSGPTRLCARRLGGGHTAVSFSVSWRTSAAGRPGRRCAAWPSPHALSGGPARGTVRRACRSGR